MRTYLMLILIVAPSFTNTSFAATGTVSPPPPDVTRLVVHAPAPEYPANSVRYHSADTGIYLLRVQIRSGAVTQVLVGRSAGYTAFDAAAVKALLKWRFKPGAVPYRKITSVPMSPPQNKQETLVKVPVTFMLKV